ncbi:sulfate adenylyltransferase subunit CysD [Rickettsiales bacterium]|nr:sulfate adenylyltransferase subunit CysD [Rickettsiales bacterium]
MVSKHLQALEDESIYIIREAIAEFENPVFLYSIGKDSSVLLHLVLKAFYPIKPPVKVLHIDTTWKFKEMIQFRDAQAKKFGLDLIVHTNQEGVKKKASPFGENSKVYTDIMKTEGLRQALDEHKFDVALGGARRDEEKSRAKERIFSFRSKFHGWDPKSQRPELFNNFNCKINKSESMRVFPLSNWTELDVWQYIKEENIEVVPLYFSKKRPVVDRAGTKIMVDDERFPLNKGETPEMLNVRFRTLGCYPLTGAIESEADNLDKIISEMEASKFSERQGRLIDSDQAGSMEKKKLEGYF